MVHDYRTARRSGSRCDALAAVGRSLRAHWAVWRFDRRHGVETSAWVSLVDVSTVGVSRDHGSPYEPVNLHDFEQLRYLDLPREGTFVDLGSGKGLALMLAVLHGFTAVKGVEFSPELCTTSRRNLERFGRSSGRQFSWRILCQDAADFQPEQEDVVFFMFNPFDDVVLATLLGNIEASLRQRRRPVHLVYHAALHGRVIEAGAWTCSRQVGPVIHYVPVPGPVDRA